MEAEELLLVALETIGKLRYCFAMTTTGRGEMSARVVQPGKPDADWRVRFMTSRSSRKVREVEQTGRMLLGYQHDPEAAYVTLGGPATIVDDIDLKRSVWTADADKWYPGGPEDPDVVLVELRTERIELWSASRNIMPGISAVVLQRDDQGWSVGRT